MNDWIIIIDDDVSNLKMAGYILSKKNMRVTALKSGNALLDYLNKNCSNSNENMPDLILLDILMPEMDGFETLKKIREFETSHDKSETPIIFLSASDNEQSETTGLKLGAMDFIRKPFLPEVLTLRVRHIIDLIRLQHNLENEVEKKTDENKKLFLHVVSSLASAIDAKDKYTNGHSLRVAEYSKEIAKRYGYSQKKQNDIYMIALLHDVGKIGVPNSVINKPAKLTNEEFDLIKKHPLMGANILKNINEMPELAIGAKYHHERYAGNGYPEGISGENIPEEARIIAVADAYDAMSSRRSYRDILPQKTIRNEIEKNIGSQFDPVFAKIMLEMIDEDKNYTMREC